MSCIDNDLSEMNFTTFGIDFGALVNSSDAFIMFVLFYMPNMFSFGRYRHSHNIFETKMILVVTYSLPSILYIWKKFLNDYNIGINLPKQLCVLRQLQITSLKLYSSALKKSDKAFRNIINTLIELMR